MALALTLTLIRALSWFHFHFHRIQCNPVENSIEWNHLNGYEFMAFHFNCLPSTILRLLLGIFYYPYSHRIGWYMYLWLLFCRRPSLPTTSDNDHCLTHFHFDVNGLTNTFIVLPLVFLLHHYKEQRRVPDSLAIGYKIKEWCICNRKSKRNGWICCFGIRPQSMTHLVFDVNVPSHVLVIHLCRIQFTSLSVCSRMTCSRDFKRFT